MARKKSETGDGGSGKRGDRKGGNAGNKLSPHRSGSPEPGSSSELNSGGNKRKNTQKYSYFHPDDETFIRFRQQLARLGLTFREIPGDGNCLFRALGDQLEGHGRNHFRHRMDTVKFMIQNKDDFEPFVSDEMSFERYVDLLSRPGTYAGQDALVAFARLHKVNIVIHQTERSLWQINGSNSSNARQIHLSYHNGEHYSSVRRIQESTAEAPANVRLSCSQLESPSEKSDKAKKKSSGLRNQKNASFNGSAAFLDSATEDDLELDSGAEGLGRNVGGAPVPQMGQQVNPGLDLLPMIMEQTGCTDELLVTEVLQIYQFNVELAVDHLLGLLCGEASTSDFNKTKTGDGITGKKSDTTNTVTEISTAVIKEEEKSTNKQEVDVPKPKKKLTAREKRAAKQAEKMDKFREKEKKRQELKDMETRSLTPPDSYYDDGVDILVSNVNVLTL